MTKVVVKIQRGRTAGKWRARFEEWGKFTFIGVADTEAEAWALFDEFESDMPGATSLSATQSKPKSSSNRKISREEWDRISREQIKLLSKKYK